MAGMRRLNTFLALGLTGVVVLLAGLSWEATRPAPAADQPAAGDAHHVADAPGATAGDAHHGAGGTDVAAVTARERMEADALVTATELALASAGFEDVAVAEAAGYRPVQPPTSSLVHYVNPAHLGSSEVLDPTAPESLVYRSTAHGPVLEGAMYILPSVHSPVPDVGGLAAHWHGHDDLCFSTATAMIVGTLGSDGRCPEGARNEVTPPMLHVWIVDRPGGPFAGL
jgi:hypothetical protein